MAFWATDHYCPQITDEGTEKHRTETTSPRVTANMCNIKFKPRLHCLHHNTALYFHISAQMLQGRYANKHHKWGSMFLNTWLSVKQRFASFKCLIISLHVLETCCFTGSLQLLKTKLNRKWNMNYTEWTASPLLVSASKGCIYFTCQKTDFHSLGDILMWFKSGVGVLFGM